MWIHINKRRTPVLTQTLSALGFLFYGYTLDVLENVVSVTHNMYIHTYVHISGCMDACPSGCLSIYPGPNKPINSLTAYQGI